MASQLLRPDDKMIFADARYPGVAERPESEGNEVDWQVARKPGQVKKPHESEIKRLSQHAEQIKVSIKAPVEHPFHIVKNLFGHRKTRYRGIAKNGSQWRVPFALANVYMSRNRVMG